MSIRLFQILQLAVSAQIFTVATNCRFYNLTTGMKALILDPMTTKIVSMVYSQTQVLEKEVYLVEQLGKRHEAMGHM